MSEWNPFSCFASNYSDNNTARGDLVVLAVALLILFWFGHSFITRYKDYLFTIPTGFLDSHDNAD